MISIDLFLERFLPFSLPPACFSPHQPEQIWIDLFKFIYGALIYGSSSLCTMSYILSRQNMLGQLENTELPTR